MVDFDKGRDLRLWIMEHTGGPAAGGLTVRDVFASSALPTVMEISANVHYESRDERIKEAARIAYVMADAMLEARITLPPQPQPTVEEAFGLDK